MGVAGLALPQLSLAPLATLAAAASGPPDIRIVPRPLLLLHEDFEPRRVEKLVARLRQERVLKNPPVVAPLPDEERFVVLDGANRVMALSRLQTLHLPVQVVHYGQRGVGIAAWNHVTVDPDPLALFRQAANLSGQALEEMTLEEAQAGQENRTVPAYLALRDGRVFALRTPNDPQLWAAVLRRLVGLYRDRGTIYRTEVRDPAAVFAVYDNGQALIAFPTFTPEEIVRFAREGWRLPTGITRHLIPGRALRLNIGLDLLKSQRPLEEKNQWLQEFVQLKVLNAEVRYYQEPVLLFDE